MGVNLSIRTSPRWASSEGPKGLLRALMISQHLPGLPAAVPLLKGVLVVMYAMHRTTGRRYHAGLHW
eukprot:SAG31_NODE_34_length_31842_cov_31.677850_36_plen_67_part_00